MTREPPPAKHSNMPGAESLAPTLLLAMPQLLDPNFHHAVILVTQHDAEGALGFIVNRPLPVPVGDILSELGLTWCGEASATAWMGGPVTPESGWVLFEGGPDAEPGSSMELQDGLRISPSIECLRALVDKPPRNLRLLLGYAGWGAGQLEDELIEGSWMFVPMSRELLFDTPPEKMWEAAYRSLGVDPATLIPTRGVQ